MSKVFEVFLCHTSLDDVYAHLIVEYLEKNGVACFIDHRDIIGGVKWEEYMLENAALSKLMIAVISQNTCEVVQKQPHILNEIDVAKKHGIPIVPVALGQFDLCDELSSRINERQFVKTNHDAFYNYLGVILNTVRTHLPRVPKKTMEFDYDQNRGIMINPEDGQRNVSFRTDTLINMMGEIYEKVVAISGDDTQADAIFFNSGYVSGKNFGNIINSKWGMGDTIEDINNKIDKWCEFDSAVGWGKFSADVTVDEENGSLSGKLCINEAFLVDKFKKRHICSFVKGYCTGVLETILSVEVELTCNGSACPIKNRFKNTCEYIISIK